jgi:threonine synthase
MRYVSTRGRAPAIGFTEALLAGLAPDGGLYVPETWPTLRPEDIAAFAGRPYAEVAADILGRFAGDEIAPEAMARMCAEAYATFDHAAVTPLVQLAPDSFMLELFHGPTLAFKDVAMQILSRLYEHALAASGRSLTIVCATSGDTGGAAVEAFAGRPGVRIAALFPEGRISEVQRRFMTTAGESNVLCMSIAGDFDDCQAVVKALFQDTTFVRDVDLSGVNSINIARIAAQCVYYFVAGVALGAPGRPVNFAVPTGNFGDALAGHIAALMGLPVARILIATNANDIVARALNEGVYRRGRAVATQSPAMDIQVASNFERLYFDACGRDPAATARAFETFAQSDEILLPPKVLAAMRMRFDAACVSEAATDAAMAAALADTGLVIDPHTAVAYAVAMSGHGARFTSPTVILSTAHPAKFPEAVHAATGRASPVPAAVSVRAGRPERIDRLGADVAAVKARLRAFVEGSA